MILATSGFAVVTGVGMCVLTDFEAIGTVPGRSILSMPGTIPWDLCDCGGYFAQTVVRKNPTEIFPVDSSNLPNKGGCADRSFMWSVTSIFLRCVPGIQVKADMTPKLPTTESLVTASLQQQVDEYTMRRAITCCLQAMKDATPKQIIDYRVAGTDFVGPEGSCGGIAITWSFQLV